MTYNCLNNVSKVISHGNEQRTLFRIVRADFIDPCQDKRTGTGLPDCVSSALVTFVRQFVIETTYTDIAEPVDNLAAFNVRIQRHLSEENAEYEIYGGAEVYKGPALPA